MNERISKGSEEVGEEGEEAEDKVLHWHVPRAPRGTA